jgi:DNA-3-methyladenine glycosylase II
MIAPRISINQAAKIKMAIARAHGDEVLGHWVFPAPAQLLRVKAVAGLNDEKLARLHGVAEAAIEGKLDADRLRAMPEARALLELEELRGVGPWTAAHILYRGAAVTDAAPTSEPRVLHGFADAYGKKQATVEEFVRKAEQWRPFRMWVCILLARHLKKIGGWNRVRRQSHPSR